MNVLECMLAYVHFQFCWKVLMYMCQCPVLFECLLVHVQFCLNVRLYICACPALFE